jgi:hypothetical protein
MTNGRGNGQVAFACYAGSTSDRGIRTLSGGQLTLQVPGTLAIQSDAAPALEIGDARSVRDVFATMGEAPTGSPIEVRVTRNGEAYCMLTIPAGETESASVPGRSRAALQARDRIGLDVTSAGQTEGGTPGRDLTVTIRF